MTELLKSTTNNTNTYVQQLFNMVRTIIIVVSVVYGHAEVKVQKLKPRSPPLP